MKYLMEHRDEGRRLEQKTHRHETLTQLHLSGFRPGGVALDAGAGTGAVARAMAELAAPDGVVYALDSSEQRIQEGMELARGLRNLTFVQGDLLAPPFDPGFFDFVWCRFVLQHLPKPEPAVQSLVSLVRPGGTLVLGDLDGHGLRHYPISDRLEQNLRKLEPALRGHQDPFMGRKLYHLCYVAGLADIEVHILPYHMYAGAAPESAIENWTTKLEVARPVMEKAFGSGADYDDFVGEFLDVLRDPGVFTYSSLILAVGTKRDEFTRGSDSSD
ncbi:MAG: methyltransferase domain-containing protein [Polyangiales bacterium]